MMQINELLQLGEPDIHGGIAIFPVYPRRRPLATFCTLDQALELGLQVREVDEWGSVPVLLVDNPLEHNVLLYDSEGLTGAKQDRVLNLSVLVAAGTTVHVPVSCVEQGRWHRRSWTFGSSGHTAHPSLRRCKGLALQKSPLAPGVAQRAVWKEVDRTTAALDIESPTRALSDSFHTLEAMLDEHAQFFPLKQGQSGALLAFDTDLCLDYVSRPDAFQNLWPKVLRGYLLDAIGAIDSPPPNPVVASRFATMLANADIERTASAGIGEDVRLHGDEVFGRGLELQGELLQLSAFRCGRLSGIGSDLAA